MVGYEPTSVKAPRWSSKVDVHDDANPEYLIATLNLDKLGFKTNVRRLFGNYKEILIMELPDVPATKARGLPKPMRPVSSKPIDVQ